MARREPAGRQVTAGEPAFGPVHELLAHTVEELEAQAIRDEALGVMKPAHRILGLTRPAVIVPAGRAWRLGILLIDRDGRLYATGTVIRAVTPKRGVADHSLAADAHRELQRAAVRGSFAEGEVVNFGYSAIPLDEASLRAAAGPLVLTGTTVTVRWDTSGAGRGSAPLESYLAERIALLTME